MSREMGNLSVLVSQMNNRIEEIDQKIATKMSRRREPYQVRAVAVNATFQAPHNMRIQ